MNYKTLLFIPGNNPGMLQNSDILGADGVIIDLEDAVAISEKDTARALVVEYLKTFKRTSPAFIRINPLGSPFFIDDLDAIIGLDIEGIVLPVSSVESMRALDEYLNKAESNFKIISLVETALGLETVFDIVKESDRIVGVFLGAEDMTLDLGAKRTKESKEIEYARSKIIAVSKAYGIQAIDTPFTDTDDELGLIVDTKYAKDMGMTGKSLINPRQVQVVNKIFAPTKEDIRYALRVVEGLRSAKEKGLGVFSLEGKMVDAPIILRAFNLLKMSGDFEEEYNDLLK